MAKVVPAALWSENVSYKHEVKHRPKNNKFYLFWRVFVYPAVSKRIRSWGLNVKVAGPDPPTAGQHSHLTALCWLRPTS